MYRVTALPLFSDNYSYIVQGALEHRLVLVDPADTQCVLAYLRENLAAYKVSHVLYTHKHYDHAGDSERLISVLRQTNADLKVLAGKVDAPYIKGVDTPIDKNCDIGLGLSVLRTILTPCHTRGHAVYTFLPL